MSEPTAPLAGHVIVSGLGRIGYRITDLLCRLDERVVVISAAAREDWERHARASGATVLAGDARSATTLEQAGLRTARAIVAATDKDIVNIETALDAREVRGDLALVMRLFDRDLGEMLEQRLGVRRAVGSSALAAPTLAYAALGQELLASLEVGGHSYVVARVPRAVAEADPGFMPLVAPGPAAPADVELVLAEQSRYNQAVGVMAAQQPGARARGQVGRWRALGRLWTGAPAGLRSVFLILLGLIALAVLVFSFGQRLGLLDAFYYVVTTVTTTGYGDITPKDAGAALKLFACLVMVVGSLTMAVLYSFATDFVVSERVRQVFGHAQVPEEGHLVVVGVGNVGYRVAEELLAARWPVVLVDHAVDGELAGTLRSRCAVITGDGRVAATLASANVGRAVAVVAATGDDASNLAIGLHARRLAPRARIVVRLFDADLARKVAAGRLVDVALSPSLLAAPTFVAASLFEGVRAAFVDEAGLCALVTRTVPGEWEGRTVAEVAAQHGAEVLLVLGDRAQPLRPDTPLGAGAEVLCAVRRPWATARSAAPVSPSAARSAVRPEDRVV
jgi:Trk K+ transport system NAD-binding subunit